MKRLLLLLILLLGCTAKEIDDKRVLDILHTEPELHNFLASANLTIERESLTIEDVVKLQQQDDAFAEWYKRVTAKPYLQVVVTNEAGTKFMALINEENKVEQILGLISVSIT